MNNFKEFLVESNSPRKVEIPFMKTDTMQRIKEVIDENEGELYIVGGAVRDAVRGEKDIKDIDFVVRFIPKEELADILRPVADVSERTGSPKIEEVGKSFGVITATIDGVDFDFALPRIGEKYKKGGKHAEGVEVILDPDAKIDKDLARRDFTINAMAVDSNGNLIDPFGGYEDLKNKKIKAVGNGIDRFNEDPLRILRALQFANRMGFDIDDKTKEDINTMQDELVAHTEEGDLRVPGDRILGEFKKAWMKSKNGNADKLLELLDTLNIGETLFGPNFKPISVDSKDETVQTIAFFFNGGDDKLRSGEWNVPGKYLKAIDLARNFAGDEEPWNFVNESNEGLMDEVKEFFQKSKMNKAEDRVNKAMSDEIPLKPKELAVGGRRLMEYGLEGSQIGEVQRELLSAIWRGKVKNVDEQLLEYVFGEKKEEELDEAFQVYDWKRKKPQFEKYNEYSFSTKHGLNYEVYVDTFNKRERNDDPTYEISFGVVKDDFVDTKTTLNSTDATDIISTVIDIIVKEIPDHQFSILFDPVKDDKGQEASQTKRGKVYLRMLDREFKNRGINVLSTDLRKDTIVMKIKR